MKLIMWFILLFILAVLLIAFLIDKRNKKIKNNPHIPTNPNAKPGEDSNYVMGDNKGSGGGHF
ncbi:hypothetical protein [Bacillus suaedaesalsae]|uniref:DUF3951 domain-containing protein n=1 Tax=Bacillus suaedaesalsae TaxID=2810349 RepID=A0ABS2DIF4_9BACI|nr:hypothetical protein [Bacillus suaedaesalsae]MBM6617790.1 hypothetical protein [Bacillus suaedaesalsae]